MCQDAIYIPVTTWKHFYNLFLGPGLVSILPCLSNNIEAKNNRQRIELSDSFVLWIYTCIFFMEIQERLAYWSMYTHIKI